MYGSEAMELVLACWDHGCNGEDDPTDHLAPALAMEISDRRGPVPPLAVSMGTWNGRIGRLLAPPMSLAISVLSFFRPLAAQAGRGQQRPGWRVTRLRNGLALLPPARL
jgi:hypothetical protein